MFRAAAIAAAVLSGTATLAWGQGASLGTDASSASRTAAPASGFTIDEKGVKRTGGPSAGQAGTVTPGGGTAPQSGRMPGKGDRTEVNADGTANRGKPSKEQKTFNESRSNALRTTSPIVSSGSGRTPGAAVSPGAPAGDTSGNKSFFESRSNTARTPADMAAKPAPTEAAPASTTSVFK